MTRKFWVGIAFFASILVQACHPVYATSSAPIEQPKASISARR